MPLTEQGFRMPRNPLQEIGAILRVFRENLIQSLARGHYRQFRNLRNQPFHLARLDFILGDAAGFARSGIDHRGCAALQLSCPSRRYQNVAVVAVEPFNQLHTLSPALCVPFTACGLNEARIGCTRSRACSNWQAFAISTSRFSSLVSSAPLRRNRSARTMAFSSSADCSNRLFTKM